MSGADSTVAARLQALEDRQAIVSLLHRYSTALDAHDWERLKEFFSDDCVVAFPGFSDDLHGPEVAVGHMRSALAGLDANFHLVANTEIELQGDEAAATSYVIAQHMFDAGEGPETFLMGGIYEDRLVRTKAGWRLSRRTFFPKWQEGNVEVLAAAARRFEELS